MSLTVADAVARIGESIRFDKAADWDPVGLQFGDLERPVERVAVCHEVTPEVTSGLIASGVDLAVSYHPLLFRPVTHLVSGSGPAGRAFELITNGIALTVVHTAFDVMPGGTADALANSLGLEDISGFGPAWGDETTKVITFAPALSADSITDAMAAAGAGRIGGYSSCSFRIAGAGVFRPAAGTTPHVGAVGKLNKEPEVRIEMIAPSGAVDFVVAALVRAHPYEEPAYDVVATRSNAAFVGRRGRLASTMSVSALADLVSERLGGVLRVAGTGSVETVAVVPGSGGSYIGGSDADVVVTGDVSHHQARTAQAAGIAVVDPGHAATERPGVQALYASIAEIVDAIDMTDIDQDPWKER